MLVDPSPRKSFSSLLDLCSFRGTRIKPPSFTFSTSTDTSTGSSIRISSTTTTTTSAHTTPSSYPNTHPPDSVSVSISADSVLTNTGPQTIFERRTASRTSSGFSSLRLEGYTDVFPTTNVTVTPMKREQGSQSDRECWERMLELQRQYHCYNSARLEAAVEALEKGWGIETVPMPSRLCLDLLNEELRARVENHQLEVLGEGFYS